MGHIIVILLVVVIIVGIHGFLFYKTLQGIKEFDNIFPKSTNQLYAYDSIIFKGKDAEAVSKPLQKLSKRKKI